jgi:hypothetical protein
MSSTNSDEFFQVSDPGEPKFLSDQKLFGKRPAQAVE